MNLKELILAANDIPTEQVHVPEWGVTVTLRGLTGTQRDQFEAAMFDEKSKGKANLNNVRARLVALSLIDESGERVFTDAEVEHLGRKSAVALDRLFNVAQKISGLTPKDVEELAGN